MSKSKVKQCKMCGEDISFHSDGHYLCYKCWKMTHDSNPYRSIYGDKRDNLFKNKKRKKSK